MFQTAALRFGFLALAVAAACQPADPVEAPAASTTQIVSPSLWGEEAITWTDALTQLPRDRGGEAWGYFWAPHLLFDYRSMVPGSNVMRRAEAIGLMRTIQPAGTEAISTEDRGFISVDGALNTARLDWGPSDMDYMAVTRLPAYIASRLEPIDADGAQRMLSALAADSWRERHASTVEPDLADDLAERWVATWSGRAPVTDLYLPDVTYRDSIAGVVAHGLDEIAAVVEAGPATEWAIALHRDGTPHVYPLIERIGVLHGLVLVVDGEAGAGCPGRVAVVLTVVDGAVATEERYWQVEPARRCLPPEALPVGWWVGRDVSFEGPAPSDEDLDSVTGVVTVDGTEIEIRNGTPAINGFVEWGVSRFAAAGLRPPDLASMAFTRHSEFCEESNGLAVRRGDQWHLSFCFHEHEVCRDENCENYRLSRKKTLLHELAHAWIGQNVDEATREGFVERTGLAVWTDPVTDWELQAREHAAETIAWGLLDEPLTLHAIGSPAPEELRRDFRFLTGVGCLQAP